ncbi:hypothetical protein NDU88_004872 [Pleurodeles waltl]|uniref:Uncharacterized protein n=1 Tax=Pleurodeles waltl TaxID=8319 RepID=A0AAV7PEB6_PLEWA|nr:hypothetical protein NDU88_004872 [Pleurodeles waltl]
MLFLGDQSPWAATSWSRTKEELFPLFAGLWSCRPASVQTHTSTLFPDLAKRCASRTSRAEVSAEPAANLSESACTVDTCLALRQTPSPCNYWLIPGLGRFVMQGGSRAAGLVKILGIWFGGPGAAAKNWNERLAKVKQKLGFWSLRHLSIEGKALVLRNDALPVLPYVTQAWPLLANVAWAVNSMVFHFVWHSKMDRVKRTVMHKEHRKGGKAVLDIPTILRAFFVCGCIRKTLLNENKDHSACRVFRFFLLPVWRRLGWDKCENATMFNWDLPWYYKEIEKFVVEFGLYCVTPSLWKPRTIHRLIRSRDTTEPVSDLPPATATRDPTGDQREVVSREACRRMVHNLLRDYTDKDTKEREKEEEL